MEWLTVALQPVVVALVQLAVVTAALHVAKLARQRARESQRELDRLRASRFSRLSSRTRRPTASPVPPGTVPSSKDRRAKRSSKL